MCDTVWIPWTESTFYLNNLLHKRHVFLFLLYSDEAACGWSIDLNLHATDTVQELTAEAMLFAATHS